MFSIQELSDFYARNVQIIQMQADGLTHEQSLIQLPFRSNCLNWVVGHLLANRYNILALLGAEDPRKSQGVDLDHYERESEPITGAEKGVLPLEDLIQLLEEAQEMLTAALAEESEESLQREALYRDRAEQTVAYWLFFLFFHDTYHVGQTEILRQAACVDDKII
jgi:uncharacterized damage-inducible protein DinB